MNEDELVTPLEGTLVLDFSQFLAGPVAALRLADLGARVIKIERPRGGDIGRKQAFAGRSAGGDTISFHAVNRNKEGLVADLKDPEHLSLVRELVAKADVLIQNFRPGVMERIGLDYDSAAAINPRLVYASASGYGETGPWRDRPGQDLLAQAVTGMPWLNGARGDGPVSVGLPIADHLTSCHLAQGITALLLRRERTGRGGHVQTSLLEAMLDLQFELLTSKFHDSSLQIDRGSERSGHPFHPAPYGMYPTEDGYLALSMNPLPELGTALDLPELTAEDPRDANERQDDIEHLLTMRLRERSTSHWLEVLDAAGLWCAPVLTLDELVEHPGFDAVDMMHEVVRAPEHTADGRRMTLATTRSPIRIDGHRLVSNKPAPRLGQHQTSIHREFFESIPTEVF